MSGACSSASGLAFFPSMRAFGMMQGVHGLLVKERSLVVRNCGTPGVRSGPIGAAELMALVLILIGSGPDHPSTNVSLDGEVMAR